LTIFARGARSSAGRALCSHHFASDVKAQVAVAALAHRTTALTRF